MAKHIVIDARIRRASTGRYIDRLLTHLPALDRDNKYTVLVEADDTWRPSAPNFRALPVRYKQFSFNPLEQIGFAWQLYRLKPDLVHFAMTQQPVFYFGNIVTTTHDLSMLRFLRPGKTLLPIFLIKKLAYRFLLWWGHRKSRFVLVPSRFVAEDMARHQPFAKSKIRAIHLAGEPPSSLKAVYLSSVNKPFILYVGTAFPHKNLERLVKAFVRLKTYNPKLNLVLAGKPEYYFDKLKDWVDSLPVKNAVIFPGWVSDGELKWLYEHAAAYVFPSLSRGFGLPGLEAMAHGCPVVSSNATCLPEIYGSAAVYFDPKSTEDMAHAINKLLMDKDLSQKLATAGKYRATKYSWRKMAQETLDVYSRVLNS